MELKCDSFLLRDAMHSADYAVARRSSVTACQPGQAGHRCVLRNIIKRVQAVSDDVFRKFHDDISTVFPQSF